jgi:WD40 repeat protein
LPKLTHCFKAHSSIIDLKVLKNNTIIYSTTKSGIRVVDSEDYSIYSNILPENLHANTITSFSPDGKVVALVNQSIISVMILETQKIIKTIQISEGKIDIVHFDDSSNYLIVGTSEGRVLQYLYNSYTQISRLCSFPHYLPDEKPQRVKNNFVSAIASYEKVVASSGYGGTIFVMDLYVRDKKLIISRSRVRVDTLCFLDKETLISGNVDGVLEVIDLNKPKQIRRLNAPFTKIKHIIPMPNKDYILVASNKNFISLINIKTLKVVDNKYLELDGRIKQLINKDKKSILVVLEDRSVQNIELLHLDKLRNLIQSDKLYQAYRLLAKAPMLRGSEEEKELEERYQETIKQTIDYMLQGDTYSAKQLTNNLRNLRIKKDEIDLVFTAFKHYEKFQLMFHEQKLNIAYAMCQRYPALKSTREYKSMEKQWHEKFTMAEKEMRLNNIQSARVLLADYMLIASKRTLIQFILYKNKEFIGFLQAIEKKEFNQISSIVKEHQTFTSLQHYKSLNEEIKNNISEAQELIKIGNTHLAQVLIDKLEENPKYESVVESLQEQSNTVQRLYSLYNDDELKKCYLLLDKTPFLKKTELGKHLEKKWCELVNTCEIYALKGQLEKLETLLQEFKKVTSRSDKVGDLLRVASQRKIIYFLQKEEYDNAKKNIYRYIDIFGLDTEIDPII